MRICLIFLTIFYLNNPTSSIRIDCAFVLNNFTFSTAVYYCTMKEREGIFMEKQLIDDFYGTHTHDRTADDIVGFVSIQTESIKFLPKFQPKLSQNFIAFAVENSILKDVRKEDFVHYPKLKAVSLSNNKIEVIKADTFEANKELESISLEGNGISHIEPFTFQHLSELRFLQMSENSCVNPFDDALSKDEVDEYIVRIDEGECISEKFTAIKIFSFERSLNEKLKEIEENLRINEKMLIENRKLMEEKLQKNLKIERKIEELNKVVTDLTLVVGRFMEKFENYGNYEKM